MPVLELISARRQVSLLGQAVVLSPQREVPSSCSVTSSAQLHSPFEAWWRGQPWQELMASVACSRDPLQAVVPQPAAQPVQQLGRPAYQEKAVCAAQRPERTWTVFEAVPALVLSKPLPQDSHSMSGDGYPPQCQSWLAYCGVAVARTPQGMLTQLCAALWWQQPHYRLSAMIERSALASLLASQAPPGLAKRTHPQASVCGHG